MEIVYCVRCFSDTEDLVHIFSTSEKAMEFAKSDPRNHVFYDYVIDCPEQHSRRWRQ